MSIQGIDNNLQLARLQYGGGAPNGGQQLPGLPPEAASKLGAIRNEQGQSVLDIRDQLQAAVKDAVAGFDGEGDLRSTIEGAVQSTLQDNGFDAASVRDAFGGSGSGFGAGALPPGLPGGLGGGAFGGGSLGGPSFDIASILGGETTEEDLVQSFLQQLRPGSSLDQEV